HTAHFQGIGPTSPARGRGHFRRGGGLVHCAVTLAVEKSILPMPPPTSTRILASYILPRFMPRVAHCLKCTEIEMCPHWRAVFVYAKSAEMVPYWSYVLVSSHCRPSRARKSPELLQVAL